MARTDVQREMKEMFGEVIGFVDLIPDQFIDAEWDLIKRVQFGETLIPNKYKELIGLAVSGATRCRYCAYFHAEAARLFGATDEEIAETAMVAKNTMGWSTYLNAMQVDYDTFVAEFEAIAAHVRAQSAEPAVA
jgi:AhpD family alkylhydroperoxidase